MSQALVRDLIDAGIHFGHRASRWNPKMGPYIFGKRNSIHIIDIRQTVKGLLRARKFLATVVAQGQDILVVGTKRQAKDSVEKHARRVGMPYVAERWLGGTLTNFKTIRSRLSRLEHLEDLVTTGKIEEFSKKEKARASREREKIARNLDGIRTMTRLPGAIVVVDIKREHIAIKEARKLRIPTVCLVDTDSDPDGADIIIPGNDDAMRAIELVIASLADAVEEGKRGRQAMAEKAGEQSAGGPGHGRRSKRVATSTLASQAVEEMGDAMPDKDIEATIGAPDSETADATSPQVPDGVS